MTENINLYLSTITRSRTKVTDYSTTVHRTVEMYRLSCTCTKRLKGIACVGAMTLLGRSDYVEKTPRTPLERIAIHHTATTEEIHQHKDKRIHGDRLANTTEEGAAERHFAMPRSI